MNCQGNHPSKNRKCERYLAEKEIIKIKIQKNISFPEARRIFEQAGGVSSYAEAAQKSELLSIVNQLKTDNKNLNKKLEEIMKLNSNLTKEMHQLKDKMAQSEEKEIERRLNLQISQLIAEKAASELTIQELRRENLEMIKQQEQEKANQKSTPPPLTHANLTPVVQIVEVAAETISSDESVHSEEELGMEVDNDKESSKQATPKTKLMTDYLLPNNEPFEKPKEVIKGKPGRPKKGSRAKPPK